MRLSCSRNMQNNKSEDILRLEKSIGYVFKNYGLLTEALTHSSYSYENNIPYNYERFEFLGDSIIEMIVSEYIVTFYADFNEGTMSSLRAHVVNEASLSDVSKSLDLVSCVYLGKGESAGHCTLKKSILADIFEAIVAAVYLDGGYDAAKKLVVDLIKERIDNAVAGGLFLDAKSEVQRICQQYFNKIPEYKVLSEDGPDHAKHYVVETDMCGLSYGKGAGPSKKKAEKSAAEAALKAYREKKSGE